MNRVALQTPDQHLLVHVDLIAMLLALCREFIDRPLDVCPCEGLSVSKQDVVPVRKLRAQRELKSHAQALTATFVGDVLGDSLPVLTVNCQLALL